jgi:hypothetical protein
MEIKKLKGRTTTIILIIFLILIAVGGFYFFFLRRNSEEKWYDANWSYRRSVYIDNITKEYQGIEEDVLLEVDTKTLIDENKLEVDCRDIRFVDEDNQTTLKYWIEGGCNTTETQIWIKVKIPNSSTKTIYMYYGNESAVDNQEQWEGFFITMQLESCPEGCDITDNFAGRFIRGSENYGEVNGSNSHVHTFFNNQQTDNCANPITIAVPEAETNCNTDQDNIVRLNSTSVKNIPPHQDMYFYRNFDGLLPENSIIMFNKPTPDSWETVQTLIGKFPRGEDGQNITTSNSHIHYTECVNKDLYVENGPEKYLTLTKESKTFQKPLEIPYYNINYITKTSESIIPVEGLLMTTELPPLGWTRFEELDGYFPKGSVTNFGDTGGVENHYHTANLSIEAKNSTREKLNQVETTMACFSDDLNTPERTSEESILPTYISVIFGQKKNNLFATLGTEISEEENVGETLGVSTTPPSQPTNLETEGQTNPTDLDTLTPDFSAEFNHPDYELITY